MIMDIDLVGQMLEEKGLSDSQIDSYFEHAGVKGMKWGVRKTSESSSGTQSRREAKQEVRDFSATAREIIRESRRAPNATARKHAANRYEKEIVKRVKTPEFKAAYQKATKMGKGEMAAHALIYGPFAPLTIKLVKDRREGSYDMEVDVAHDILREMRTP